MKPLKLNKRDRRALIVGGICVGLMLVYVLLIGPWLKRWSQVRADLSVLENRINQLAGQNDAGKAQQRILAEKTPVLALPNNSEDQRLIFKKAMIQQARQSGLALSNIKYAAEKKATDADYSLLLLEGRINGPTEMILKYLADLYRNEHVCAIENLELITQENERDKQQFSLTVSTVIKQAKP
ncbi:MAG: type II secretion system protein M [Sedimentisphaerales bacterium]|nr:type II secretion system protein M [Sedimentisphaerales bacterium]